MFGPVKTVKHPRFQLRRSCVLAVAGGLLLVFVAGAAGAAQPSFTLDAVAAAGSRAVDAAVADFNGDGTPDLAVASWNLDSHDIAVLLGVGAGGFQPGPRLARQDRRPTRLFTADFNGDGKIDLAVSQRDKDFFYEASWVSILLGNGRGGFSTAPGSPLKLAGLAAVSDLNGDGKADLVLLQEGRVAVLLGDGSTHFTPAPGSPFAAGKRLLKTVAVADFNGDGKPDLAVAGEGGLWLLLGTTSGRFGAARRVTSASGPLAVADFNGDKKPDLAVGGATLSILLRNGADGFSDAPGSPMKDDYRNSIAAADFNADGKADLATASDNSHSVMVLLGDGASRFHRAPGSSLGLTLPFRPSLLAATDLNSDGKLDLLARATVDHELAFVAEEGEDRLAILLEAPSVPAPAVLHGRALPSSSEVRLTTAGTITKLAADGDRAAAITNGGCGSAGGVVVWTASTGETTSYEARRPAQGSCLANEVALGGNQVAWIVTSSTGNTQGSLEVFTAKLSGGAAKLIDDSSRARAEYSDHGLWLGHLLGGGPLLAYNRWRTACINPPPDYGCTPPDPWLRVSAKSLVQVAAGRRVVVKLGADSYRLAAVGGGRMAVQSPDGAVTVLASSGRRVATVPAPNGNLPQSIALSRTRLALVRWSGALELYSPGTGKKTKSVTLGAAAALELAGVNAKLALLRSSQRLVLVRLSDGKLLSLPLHAVIDPTLTEAGLFFAYNVPRARQKGRIAFEPTAKLLARF